MSGGVAEKTRWQLTQNAFDKLLWALDPQDREQAGENYLLLRRNLIRYFEGRGFAPADEAADEVCNRLARKIEAGETIENVNQYSYGIARLLALELYKEQQHRQQSIDELSRSESPSADEDQEERHECLSECLGELSAENRQLIVGYYQGERREKIENRQKLSEKMGIPQNALRSRAVRLREKLEACLSRCLKRTQK